MQPRKVKQSVLVQASKEGVKVFHFTLAVLHSRVVTVCKGLVEKAPQTFCGRLSVSGRDSSKITTSEPMSM